MRLIDADELKKVIEDSVSQYGWQYSADMINMWALFSHIVNDTPTVEKPQGEWVVIYDEDNVKTCKCSICGRMEDIVDFGKYPFCHCGAKMKGGVE